MAGICYDIEGNTVDCTDSGAIGFSQGSSATDIGAGIDLSSSSPAAVMASSASNNGGSILTTILGFGTAAINKLAPSTTPARTTVQQPLFNTGTQTTSMLMLFLAIILAFFIFKKAN